MARSQSGGSNTRNVHHGNMMNKRGCAATYKRSVRPVKFNTKKTHLKEKKVHQTDLMERDIGDLVVRAGPPQEDFVGAHENRFVIPSDPNNVNIIQQTYVRSHAIHSVVMSQLKTKMGSKDSSEECVEDKHEIEELPQVSTMTSMFQKVSSIFSR